MEVRGSPEERRGFVDTPKNLKTTPVPADVFKNGSLVDRLRGVEKWTCGWNVAWVCDGGFWGVLIKPLKKGKPRPSMQAVLPLPTFPSKEFCPSFSFPPSSHFRTWYQSVVSGAYEKGKR